MLALLLFLLIPVFPYPVASASITMQSELDTEPPDAFHRQIVETISEALNKSLKAAISTLSLRQDRFEELSSTRLGSLGNQISNLLLSLSNPLHQSLRATKFS